MKKRTVQQGSQNGDFQGPGGGTIRGMGPAYGKRDYLGLRASLSGHNKEENKGLVSMQMQGKCGDGFSCSPADSLYFVFKVKGKSMNPGMTADQQNRGRPWSI